MRERLTGLCRGAGLLAMTVLSSGAWPHGVDNLSPLPKPLGPYAVGRTSFDWTDESRPDAESPNGHREIVVWVWYPGAPGRAARRARWMPGQWAGLFWSKFVRDFPDSEQKGERFPVAAVRTHSFDDAPFAPAPGKYPVLLFAPGKGELPLEYSSLIEDIVSHGYIVAGIVPTHDCGFTIFADGRIVADSPPAPLRPEPGTNPQRFMASVELEMARTIRRWSGDLAFALDRLEVLNADTGSAFYGRLDLKRVGAFGHSLGGASSFQVGEDDPRVTSIADLDGMLSPDVAAAGSLAKPVLVLNSDVIPRQVLAANRLQSYVRVLRSATPGYQLRLAGSTHYYSADLALMPFLPDSARAGAVIPNSPTASPRGGVTMMLTGATAPARSLSIAMAYVEAFFDQSLKGKRGALLQGASPDYPEVSFEFTSVATTR